MSITLDNCYQLLDKLCAEMHICASVWGSLQRNELTPLSDIDIVCYSKAKVNYDALKSSIEKRLLNYTLNSYRLDIALIESSPYEYALINGTNFHSVYFSDKVVGDDELSSFFVWDRDRLRNNIELTIREFFNLFTSYFGLARVLNSKDARYAKFSLNGTNKWVRLAQAAQLRWNYLIGKTTKDVLFFLCQKYHLTAADYLDTYEFDYNNRIKSENVGGDEFPVFNKVSFNRWHFLLQLFIIDCIPWIQSNSGVSIPLFNSFCKSMGMDRTVTTPPKSINLCAEAVINAFVEKDLQKINSSLVNNINNWWIMTNLCVNEHVSSEFLERIVFPDFEVDPVLWKSIRLYVAKNKNTSEETLVRILNTEGLREQDYLAAQNNLDSRNKYYNI